MDIARGSRRARHVAANAAAANQPDQQQQQRQRQRGEGSGLGLGLAQRQAQGMHRTPDQRSPSGSEAESSLGRMPRPNPFLLRRAVPATTTPRLSLPLGSDGSESEPDISVLEMARGGRMALHQHRQQQIQQLEEESEETQHTTEEYLFDEDSASQDQYDIETSVEGEQDIEEHDLEDQDLEEEQEVEEQVEEEPVVEPLLEPSSIGLKEISNLGKFTVSSHKPGNGVEELRTENLKQYWQSDGPQPHKLTIYFVKRVGIRVIRFYVDYREDESYTPTKIVFKSGTSENNLIEFATMSMDNPCGWQDVPIAGSGGEPDGNTLVSYVLQMQIMENHQNGKDTHLRGIKIYAFDPDINQSVINQQTEEMAEAMASAGFSGGGTSTSSERLSDIAEMLASSKFDMGDAFFTTSEFMREPEIR